MNRYEAKSFRNKIESIAVKQDDADALQSIKLFPVWKVGVNVFIGERYQYQEKLYRVIQSHTTQNDWTPDIAKNLFTEVSIEEWPAWVQPTGAQDAYNTGDKVTHNNKHWISNVDWNVWEPGVYGWDEQI